MVYLTVMNPAEYRKYVHMIEKGNGVHIESVRDVRTSEVGHLLIGHMAPSPLSSLQEKMRRFCESLPADRLLQGNDYDLDSSSDSMRRSFTDPETGAKLTYGSSLTVLSHFVSCLVSSTHRL
jgi:endoribonuclease Dicer